MDEELERFKRTINLAELAASFGFEVEGKPYPSGYTMRSGSSKIVVATASDGHGIFFEVHGNADGGSVVDFVMWQKGCSLGYARKFLREYTGAHHVSLAAASRLPKPVPVQRDRAKVIAEWEGMRPYEPGYVKPDYLLDERGLTPETLARFAGSICVAQGKYKNICFCHEDETGVTGYEVKNYGFTGFSPGGEKALFMCQVGEKKDSQDQFIFITESAIDAMSLYQLNSLDGIYLSIAGGLSKTQPELLRRTLAQYPEATIIVATDNDLPTKEHPKPAGEQYYETIRGLCPQAATVVRLRPPDPYKDWNDVLNDRPRREGKGSSHAVRIARGRSAAKTEPGRYC